MPSRHASHTDSDRSSAEDETHVRSSRRPSSSRLRDDYVIHAQIGLAVALLVLLAAIHADFRQTDEVEVLTQEQERIDLTETTRVESATEAAPPRPLVPEVVPDDEITDGEPVSWNTTLEADPERVDEMLISDLQNASHPEDIPEIEETRLWRSTQASDIEVIDPQAVEEGPRPIGGREALEYEFRYPEAAQRLGIEGSLRVSFLIDEEGNVHDVQVPFGAHYLLDEETARALQEIQFEPAQKEGEPVAVRTGMQVRFELER